MSQLVEVKIEDPGNTEEVEVIEVLVSVGQQVAAGEPLFEVATDKANVELESPAAGVVEELLAAAGDIVDVGHVFAVVRA